MPEKFIYQIASMSQIKKFNEYFNIPGFTDLDSYEQKFEKKILKAWEKVKNLDSHEKTQAVISKTHADADIYFDYAKSWVEQEIQKNPPKDSPEGKEVKQKTFSAARSLEEPFKSYLSLALTLEYYLKTARMYLKQEESELEIIPKMEWDNDTQIFIEKNLQKIPGLKEEIARLESASELVAKLGPKLESFEEGLYDWLGRQEGRRKYNMFLSALRGMNEDKALRVLKGLKEQKGRFRIMPGKSGKKDIIRIGRELTKSYLSNITLLMLSGDRMYLKKNEVTISLDVALKELKKAQALVNKYHHAFLKDRVQSLHKLQERLKEIGEIHHILRLYRTAFKGMLTTVHSFEEIRIYEASLYGPLDYLVQEKIRDITYISQKAEKLMKTLQEALRQRLTQIV